MLLIANHRVLKCIFFWSANPFNGDVAELTLTDFAEGGLFVVFAGIGLLR